MKIPELHSKMYDARLQLRIRLNLSARNAIGGGGFEIFDVNGHIPIKMVINEELREEFDET